MSADYYAILEIDRDADQASIRASYRHLAKLHHPDKNPNNLQATTRFQQLNDAYTTLNDPERRKTYDTQHLSTRTKPRTTKREGGTSKAHQNSAGIDERVVIKLAIERIAELDKKIKELGKTMKEIATRFESLAQHISNTTLPMLNRLHLAQAYQSEVSKGWSSFFSALRQSKDEREERRRRTAVLEEARVAKEEEYEMEHDTLRRIKLAAAQICGLIIHARRQKTVLESTMEEWLRSAPDTVHVGQLDAGEIRGQVRVGDETAQTKIARYGAVLELKETLRRQQEDPDEEVVGVVLP